MIRRHHSPLAHLQHKANARMLSILRNGENNSKMDTIMNIDFDRVFERSHTHSVKWELAYGGGEPRQWDKTSLSHGDDRVLPMWVADMDFLCAEPIVTAIKQRAAHPVFGYSDKDPSYLAAVREWMLQRHAWSIEPDWIITTPGIVPAAYMAVQAHISAGDKVLIQTPVYHPFYRAAAAQGGEIVSNPLKFNDGRYQMDFDDLAAKAADPLVKMALLCSPHNPVGRVWNAEELRTFGEICQRNGVLVLADEIHHDIVFAGNKFIPYAVLGEKYSAQSLTGTSASKSFNLAGLQTANVIIPDTALRNSFKNTMVDNGLFGMNPFGIVATEAAYRSSAQWLDALIGYLQDNIALVREFLRDRIPKLKLIEPEATYLLWIDCRDTGLTGDEIHQRTMDDAKLHLNKGAMFGPEGAGFERMNIGCPRSVVKQALVRLERCFG